MTKEQSFNRFLVIFGFCADAIGIRTFIAGMWISGPSIPGRIQIASIYLLFAAITVAYGWAYITYLLASSRLKKIPTYNKEIHHFTAAKITNTIRESTIRKITQNATISIGILTFPLSLLWWYGFYANTYTNVPLPNVIAFSIVSQIGLGFIITQAIGSLLPLLYSESNVQ
jgi:hypothetical protein